MAKKRTFAIGVDYGTNSVRALVVDVADGARGRHRASTTIPAARRASCSIRRTRTSPGRTRPTTSRASITSVRGAVDGGQAASAASSRRTSSASASTRPARRRMPVDRQGTPLAMQPEFRKNLAAQAWLWKDHTGHRRGGRDHREGRASIRDGYLAKCGGTYSSEWYWSKILHCKRTAPEGVRGRLLPGSNWPTSCPAYITGNTRSRTRCRAASAPPATRRCTTTSGAACPSKQFLGELDPDLAGLRERYATPAVPADQQGRAS